MRAAVFGLGLAIPLIIVMATHSRQTIRAAEVAAHNEQCTSQWLFVGRAGVFVAIVQSCKGPSRILAALAPPMDFAHQSPGECRYTAVFYAVVDLADGGARGDSELLLGLVPQGNLLRMQQWPAEWGVMVRCARGCEWYKRVWCSWCSVSDWRSLPEAAVSHAGRTEGNDGVRVSPTTAGP